VRKGKGVVRLITGGSFISGHSARAIAACGVEVLDGRCTGQVTMVAVLSGGTGCWSGLIKVTWL